MDRQYKAGCNLAIIGGSVATVLMGIAYIHWKCRRKAWSMLGYLLVAVAAVAAVVAALAVCSLLLQVVSLKGILDDCRCTDIISGVITVLPSDHSSGNTKLTSDDQFDVTVVANSSGDSVLLDCCQGAHKQSVDSFTFAIANNSQKTLRYMFDKLDKTNFSVNSGRIATGISNSYVLSLRMQQEDYPTTYVAYFYSHPVQNLRWKIRIIIEPAESPSEKVDEEKWWEKARVKFQFTGEEIHLGLAGGSNISDDGCWKIIAITSDTINVKRFKRSSADCIVEWMTKCMDASPEPYYHIFYLHGTEPTVFYTMYMNPNQAGPESSGVIHDGKVASETSSEDTVAGESSIPPTSPNPSKEIGEGISAFLVVVSIAVVALIAKVFPPTTQDKLQRKMARSPENEAIRQCEAKLVTEVEKSLDRIVGEAHPGKLITDDQWDEIMQLPATKRQRAQKFVNCMLGTVKDSATFKKFCELLRLPGCIDSQSDLAQELEDLAKLKRKHAEDKENGDGNDDQKNGGDNDDPSPPSNIS